MPAMLQKVGNKLQQTCNRVDTNVGVPLKSAMIHKGV
jgi:hypothetical protein